MPERTTQPSEQPDNFVHNRIRDVLLHTTRYAFKGEARLAADSRISKAGLSRILNGLVSPSFRILCKITAALEKAVEKPIDPREILSFTGTYPTPSVCELVGCRGCLPESAYFDNDERRPGFPDSLAGKWSVADASAGCASPTGASASAGSSYPAKASDGAPFPLANQTVSTKEAP